MEPWKEAIVSSEATLEKVISVLDASALRIVLVVNSDGNLEGTISDGDVRRGLLRGLSLSNKAKEVLCQNPHVVEIETSRHQVLELMRSSGLFQIPIIDKQKKLVGLHLWERLNEPKKRENLMVIMAGGKGTRLLPKTEKVPKSMLTIMGKPILQHIIERAINDGISRFAIAVHHLREQIEDYFSDGSNLGVDIQYLREPKPLGTAGALSLIADIPSEPILVCNGDILTDVRFGAILDYHLENKAFATMAVQIQEYQNPFGVVKLEGNQIRGYEEKPVTRNLINAGVYVLNPASILHLDKSSPFDMPSLFNLLNRKNSKLVAFPIHEKWIDIGRPEDFERASRLDSSEASMERTRDD
jgi:dTDP-glucose pyrophosphorylase